MNSRIFYLTNSNKATSKKKFILEDDTEREAIAETIYRSGMENKNFDYDKGLQNLININARTAFFVYAGSHWKKFDYEKGLNEVIKRDRTGIYTYRAGRHWPKNKVDYEKALDALIKKDDTGEWIYKAGKDWHNFNYIKGSKALLGKDTYGEWIYRAGVEWDSFSFKEGLAILKRISRRDYYMEALEDWPKTASETLGSIETKKDKAKKIKDRKLALESTISYPYDENEELDNLVKSGENASREEASKILKEIIKKDSVGRYIYRAGKNWKNFNVKEGLVALGNISDSSRWVYKAGTDWKNFDFEMGLDTLYKVDVGGKETMYASNDWDHFDFKKGLDILIKNDKDGMNIYSAGVKWPKETFDFKKAFEALITKKNENWIYEAGRDWSKFNYKRGLKELANRNTSLLNRAKKDWPLINARTALGMSKVKSKEINKSKDKKLTLESLNLDGLLKELK